MLLRISFAAAVLLSSLTVTPPAAAHLLSAGYGAVNLREDDAIILIGVPAFAFTGVDDDGDGLLQPEEIQRHTDDILAQLGAGFSLTVDGKTGTASEQQLLVSVHADDANSTTQVEWWARIALPDMPKTKACTDVVLRWFLAAEPSDKQVAYNIQVRNGEAVEVAILSKDAPAHRFLCESQ